MAITKSKKEQIVSKLSQLVKKADLVVFLKFKKLTVAKANELRRKLRGVGGSYTVAKKRLARIVLKDEGVEMPKLEGEVAFIVSGDDSITTAKEVQAFAKANKEAAVILGGVFSAGDGSAFGGQRQLKLVDAAMVARLASIPPREVLIAQVLGVIQGPFRGFMGVLNGNQRKLVTTLKQIAEKK